MKFRSKRFVALMLTIIMVMNSLQITAFAADTDFGEESQTESLVENEETDDGVLEEIEISDEVSEETILVDNEESVNHDSSYMDEEKESTVENAVYSMSLQGEFDDQTQQSFENAVELVRNSFLNGVGCTVTIELTEYIDNDRVFQTLKTLVYEHTGNPKEGDTLYMCRPVGSYSIEYDSINGIHQYKVSLSPTCYTTAEQEQELDLAVEELLNQLSLDGKTDSEKIAAIYDYVCQNVEYAYVDTTEDKLPFTAYGALVNKYAACQGYALLIYRLALEVGIDARYIRGTACDSNHAWNIVQLEDGLYYNLDATWDAGRTDYQYFLCSEEEFSDHIRNPEYTTVEFKEKYPMYSTSVSVDGWNYVENADGSITLIGMNNELEGPVVIPEEIDGKTVSGLGGHLLGSYDGITGIIIPDSITYIEKGAFSGCLNLQSIVFKGSAVNIEEGAFDSNVSAYYPYDDQTWTEDYFKDYGGNILWKSYSVADIDADIIWVLRDDGELIISGCGQMPEYGSPYYPPWYSYREDIKSVVINDGITSIIGAFYRCKNMMEVYIPDTVVEIGTSAFEACTSLKSIVMPNNVESIGASAFFGCDNLEGIIGIPASVEYIGRSAFGDCPSIEEILVDENNKYYCSVEGALYDIGCTTLLAWSGKGDDVVHLVDGISVIGENAFSCRRQLIGIEIPESVETIETGAFYGCSNLISIRIPDKITRIEPYTFFGCSSLKEVIIPEGVTSIGYDGFWECESLEEIQLPDGLNSLEKSVFYGCSGLKSIKIPEGIIAIEPHTFAWCSSLSDVLLPSTLTDIGTAAFHNCNSLTEITIPEGVTKISDSSFSVCTQLKKVTFKGEITDIEENAFTNCDNLTDIELPDSVVNIGESAFLGCKRLTDINIPKGVRTIGESAFAYCGLETIEIPEGVTSIGAKTFQYCEDLKSVIIPQSVSTVGDEAFYACYNLSYAYFMGEYPNFGNQVFYGAMAESYYPKESTTWSEEVLGNYGGTLIWKNWSDWGVSGENQYWLVCDNEKLVIFGSGQMYDYTIDAASWDNWALDITEVTFSIEVNSVGNNAFKGCSNIKNITFLGKAPDIEDNAFVGVTADIYYPMCDETWTEDKQRDYGGVLTWKTNKIAEGVCGESVEWFLNSAGLLYVKGNGKMLNYSSYSDIPWYEHKLRINKVVIENGVSNIGDYAFYGCSMKRISIPSSVTRIGNYAFYGYDGEELFIPEGVKEIGSYSFSNSTNVKEIIIPEGVTSIGTNAFSFCGKVSKVIIPSSVTDIGSDSFFACSNLKSAGPVGGDYSIEYGWIDKIPDNAFSGCGALTEIMINDDVISIGSNSFANCGIENITIPESVVTIGENAFKQSCITQVTIPKNVTDIGIRAFAYCDKLKEIRVDSSNKNYSGDEDGALLNKDQTELIQIPGAMEGTYEIPDSVTDIIEYAGSYCRKLKEIVIPDNVTTIGESAFSECNILENIVGGNGIIDIGYEAFQGTNLSNVIIGDKVEKIGGSAFYQCENLTSVVIGKSVNFMDNGVFSGCSKLKRISVDSDNACFSSDDSGVLFNKDKTVLIKIPEGIEIDYTIPNTVTTIGDYAVKSCVGLKSIIIPDSVLRLGREAFENCTNLSDVIIGKNVKQIKMSAFLYCSNLHSIIFRGDVPQIDSNAFSTLTCVAQYPAESESWTEDTLQNYGGTISWEPYHSCDYTFEIENYIEPTCIDSGYSGDKYCPVCGKSEVGSEIPPNGHTEIIDDAVPPTCMESGLTEGSHCSVCGIVLKSQTLVPSLGYKTHTEVVDKEVEPTCVESGLTEGSHCSVCGEILVSQEIIPMSGHTFVDGTCTECGKKAEAYGVCGENVTWALTDEGILTIGGNGRMNNYSRGKAPWSEYADCIESVIIKKGIVEIGSDAFWYCKKINKIIIPDSVQNISSEAFAGCSNLSYIEIPNSVLSIGYSAFNGCDKLKEIIIPNNVSGIGTYAFANCIALTDIVIPGSISTISRGMFSGCTGLTLVEFVGKAPTIEDEAFRDVIATCYYPADDNTWNKDIMKHYGGHLTWIPKEKKIELAIVSQPVNQIVSIGENAVFSIEAVGKEISYQWQYRNVGSNIWRNSSMSGYNTSEITINVTKARIGQQYRCVITDSNGNMVTTDEVQILLAEPDVRVVSQPSDYTGTVGEMAVFIVEADGEALSYQWQYCNKGSNTWRNSSMTGADTNCIEVKITEGRIGQKYRCVITAGSGDTVTTDAAQILLVEPDVKIVSQPADYKGTVGGIAVFFVEAEGEELIYQWQYCNKGSNTWRNSSMTGADTNRIEAKITEGRIGQKYRCVIRSGSGYVTTTDEAQILLAEPDVEIVSQPSDYTGTVGEMAVFNVEADGGALSYQWQYCNKGLDVWRNSSTAGADTNRIEVKITEGRIGQKYRCVIRSGSGYTVTTDEAQILLAEPAIKIISQPSDYSGNVGDVATFRVEAEGEGLTYQWQYRTASGSAWRNSGMDGATTQTLNVQITKARNGQSYRCIITDMNGNTLTSEAAVLTVN